MSIAGPSCALFTALMGVVKLMMNGVTSSATTPACTANAMACVQPKSSSLDQMSLTLTGLIPGGSGAGFGGLKKSLKRSPKPPKLLPHSTSRRLFVGPLGAAGAEMKNFKFSAIPEPKEFFVKGTSLRSTTFTGRSKRNCLRLDQKLSGIRIAGVPKSGSAALDTGMTSSGPERLGLLNSSGSRLMNPGTFVPRLFRRELTAKSSPSRYDSRSLGKVARPPPADTASPFIVTYVVTLLSDVSQI